MQCRRLVAKIYIIYDVMEMDTENSKQSYIETGSMS